MNQKQVFLKASRIVRERGLKKGSFGLAGNPVCAVGAIYEAEFGDPQKAWDRGSKAAHQADAWVEESVPGHVHLTTWSDQEGNTDEVADVLWLLGQVA